MRNHLWAGVAWALLLAGPAGAQEAVDTAIVRRLEQAERMIELLQGQIADQAVARVEPRSRNLVELGGTVLLNGFYNNAKVNYSDSPSYVSAPDPAGGLPASAFGGSARQSRITLRAFAPDVLGGSFSGEIDVDFAGGHLKFGRLFPLLHLRRTRAELAWPNAYVMVGQEAPPISEINPSTLAAIALPGFTASGNLWFWIPQIRVGVAAGEAIRIGLEATALSPVSNDVMSGTFEPTPDRAERSRRPYLQGRVITRWDQPNTTGEFSVGAHYGWLATAFDSLIVSRAAAATTRFSVTPYVEVRARPSLVRHWPVSAGGVSARTSGSAKHPCERRAAGLSSTSNRHPSGSSEAATDRTIPTTGISIRWPGIFYSRT